MSKTRKLTTMSMLIALAIVLAFAFRFPIFAAVPFLEYDAADIPILIGTFIFGPVAGIIMTVIVSVLQGLTVSAGSSWYGIIMHIIATGVFVLTAGCIYNRNKTQKTAVIGLAAATVVEVVVMFGANLVITPLFTGMPVSAVMDLMWVGIVPFNIIRWIINSVVTFLVYKPISNLVKNQGHKDTKESPEKAQ